jgi:hypothetical protein
MSELSEPDGPSRAEPEPEQHETQAERSRHSAIRHICQTWDNTDNRLAAGTTLPPRAEVWSI